VLEIDGKQHYSDGDRSSPRLYAEMAAEDRRLKLRGYEVFRFGGDEFRSQFKPEAMLAAFFTELFARGGYQMT
jgi:very-short-patch-repair endonuclease